MPGTKPVWFTQVMPTTLLEAITNALPGFRPEQLVARNEWPQSTLYRVYLSASGETPELTSAALDKQINALQKADLSNAECKVFPSYCQWPSPMNWNPDNGWVASVSVDIPVNHTNPS